MEVVIGIISVILALAGVYIAYLQLRRTPPEAQLPSKEVLPIVENAQNNLNSSESKTREDAINTLASTDHPSALDALIKASQHPTVDVRRASLRALQSFDDQDVFRTFEKATSDSDTMVKVEAVKGIARSTNSIEANQILEKAMSDPDAKVRIEALKGIINFAHPSSVNILLIALYDKNAEIAESALRTLLLSPVYNKNPTIIRPLTICWKDVYYQLSPFDKYVQHLREEAERVLASFGELAIEPILQVVDETKQLEKMGYKLVVHMVASKALALICSPKAIPAYLYFIDENNYSNSVEFENIRGDAALALAKLGDKRALPALKEARDYYWTEPTFEGYLIKTKPSDGIYRDPFTLALRELGEHVQDDD